MPRVGGSTPAMNVDLRRAPRVDARHRAKCQHCVTTDVVSGNQREFDMPSLHTQEQTWTCDDKAGILECASSKQRLKIHAWAG
jgi:hypothetical protein